MRRITRAASAFCLCAALALGHNSAPAAAAEAELSAETRRAIESVLKKKVEGLLAEKNDEGAACKRGSYSRSFR
ncbi:MAG TPA: hypothetical protein VE222_11735, partial [Nitrospiraceae bacterium]|nr:hypothetical protein [Nitrospiraceae bacterium]